MNKKSTGCASRARSANISKSSFAKVRLTPASSLTPASCLRAMRMDLRGPTNRSPRLSR